MVKAANKVAHSPTGMRACMFCLFLMIGAIQLRAQSSQVPLLERVIFLSIENETLEATLKMIGKSGNFTFSYSSTLFDEKEKITYHFSNRTVREILDQLFKGKIEYRERGRYIILIKSKKETSSRDSKVFSGYVIDEATGERLKDVSIYDPVTLSSAVTDSYGFFKIEIKRPTGEDIKLAVNKNQYTDTLLVVPARNRQLLKIPIRVNKEKLGTMADSVGSKFKRIWTATKKATEQAINMENISDTIYRTKQFSFFPFVGTNGSLSGNVINDYSFNVFGGYSLGNRKAEFAGLFNTIRGNVEGVQVAGLANGVLGNQKGVQFAGLTNLTRESTNGVQFAGLVNFTLGESRGTAFGGIGNFSLGDQQGAFVGGLFNFTSKNAGPIQMAGILNFAGVDFNGMQLSGILNYTHGNFKGAQVSGLINISPSDFTGAQVAGVVNIAKEMRGVQVGLLNFSKKINGVPIGFLSLVTKGYHKLEISADEIFYTNLAFRTGVRQFYNILTVGAKPETFEDEETFWSFGYGVGTAPKISKKIFLNFDITSNQIVKGEIEKINLLNKLYAGFDFQLAKNFSITAGVTLNAQVTDSEHTEYPELFSSYSPEIIHERDFGSNHHLKMWLGGKVGVRFF